MSRAGEAETVKSARRTVNVSVAVCEPLVPATVKLNGFGVEAPRFVTVTVLFCPANMVAGLKVQLAPDEHAKVMFPVKLLGPDAETV